MFLATIAFTIYVPDAMLWLPKQVMPQSVGCFQEPERHRLYLPAVAYLSGSGMNSGSPGTLAKRPSRQSALACSMRSLLDDTKFHQI